MTTALDQYLRDCRIRGRDFARDLGISESALSRLRNNRQGITLEMAFRIEKATGGAVLASSWLSDDGEPVDAAEGLGGEAA